VGEKEHNPWRVFDMHGNVWEWVADDWHETFDLVPSDGTPWKDKKRNDRRIARGGSWKSGPESCKSSSRRSEPDWRYNKTTGTDIGFRCAMSIPRL
jgi:formylglycine-generating enzyme required for sulfatase activity